MLRKKIDWHNYTLIEIENKRKGPGENGKAFKLTKPEDIQQNNILNKVNGYWARASDIISKFIFQDFFSKAAIILSNNIFNLFFKASIDQWLTYVINCKFIHATQFDWGSFICLFKLLDVGRRST